MSRWVWGEAIFAILLFVTQVNTVSAGSLYSSEGLYTAPVTAYVDSAVTYSVAYNGIENDTTYPLTPETHGADCNLVFPDTETSFSMAYSAETESYSVDLVYSEVGNPTYYMECSATEYTPIGSFPQVQEVAPGQTAILLNEVNPSSPNFVVSALFYSTGSGNTLTFDDNAYCTAYIYDQNGLTRDAEMTYDEDEELMYADVELGQHGDFTWHANCTADNFESASSEIGSFFVPYATEVSYEHPIFTLVFEPFTIEINYTVIFDNGTTELIAPVSEGDACYVTFDGSTFLADYNSEKTNYNAIINTNTVGTFYPEVSCTATGYEINSASGTNIDIIPANSSVRTFSNSSGNTVNLTASYHWTQDYNSEKRGSLDQIIVDEATCNAIVYNSNDEVVIETPLSFDNQYQYVASVELEPGTYHWTATCGGLAAYQPATSAVDLVYSEETTCGNSLTSGFTEISSEKTCTSENDVPVFIINNTNDVELTCNGNSITGIGDNLLRSAVWIENASNVTISQCVFENYAYAITIVNSTNVNIKNLTTNNGYQSLYLLNTSNVTVSDSSFTNATIDDGSLNGRSAIKLFNGADNVTFSNITVRDYSYGLQIERLTNSLLSGFSFNNVTIAMVIANGTNSTLRDVNITGAAGTLALIGENYTVENVLIRNSTIDLFPNAYFITNGTTTTNFVMHNSSRDAFWLFGENNTLSMNISNTNGTGVTLFGELEGTRTTTTNNIIYLNGFGGNTLDLAMNDSSGLLYNNTFVGNFTSIFANVTNSSHEKIATFTGLTFTGNGAYVTYSNLTLFNLTGLVYVTNALQMFNFTSTSVSLDSALTPILSQFATITLTGVSYTNTSMYNVLKDGTTCSTCIKVSSNPTVFQVFGFSNYSTSAVETPTTITPPPTTPPGNTPPSTTPSSTPIPTVNPVNTTNTTKVNNTKVNSTTLNTTSLNNTSNSTIETNNSTSALTGLFTMPKEFNNPMYQVAGAITLLAFAGAALYFKSGAAMLSKIKPPKIEFKKGKK